MAFFSSAIKLMTAGTLCIALAACKTPEEEAREFYEDALSLIEQGDTDRAIVQLRNASQTDPALVEARSALGAIFLERGDFARAYRQYLRVAEQIPDDVESRFVLAEIAFDVQNWEEYQRHGTTLQELAPDELRTRIIAIGMEYQQAVEDEELTALEGIAIRAGEIAADNPDNPILTGIMLDDAARRGDYDLALANVDKLLERRPDSRTLLEQRLNILFLKDDQDGVEQHLRDVVEQFPEDIEAKTRLVQFFLAKGDMVATEDFLRAASDPSQEDPGLFFDLVTFLGEIKGFEAAEAELERAIEVAPDPQRYQALLAGVQFSRGEQQQAIDSLRNILDTAEEGADTDDVKVSLAWMLVETGNEVGSRALVEEVLAADASNSEALKLQATWQIEADQTDEAIANLRLALDNAPNDAEAMTLMAQAYTRTGSNDLARDFLALAVDASENAPAESIRYAQLLISEERYLPAEDILISSLRKFNDNVEILQLLGRLYLAMEDFPRTDQVIATLRRLDTDETRRIATGLEADRIIASSGPEEAAAFLESVASGEDASQAAQLMLVRARLVSGENEAAIELMQQIASEAPNDTRLQFVLAQVLRSTGDLSGAEETYRTILARSPDSHAVTLQLVQTIMAQGRRDEGVTLIDDTLNQFPDSPDLLWAKASMLEQNGDYAATLEIYEKLYAQDTSSVLMANNLASMLSTYSNDPADLERAWTIARRLKDIEAPAVQDTYGWILHLRGQSEAAIDYLESAANGLAQDALVQFHLGSAYAAVERNEDAIRQFERALELAGSTDTRPQFDTARSELDRLRALPTE